VKPFIYGVLSNSEAANNSGTPEGIRTPILLHNKKRLTDL